MDNLTGIQASGAAATGHVLESADRMDVDTNDSMAVNPRELHVASDYGSRNLSTATRVSDGSEADPNSIIDLFSSRQEASIPQIIAFGRKPAGQPRGEFYWGEEAEDAIARGLVPYENIITLWKIAFYRDHARDRMATQVHEQLRRLGLTLVELVSMHLKEVMKTVMAEIRESTISMGAASSGIDRLPSKMLLCVPVLWDSPTNRMMTDAATLAGISQLELVLESECAVGYYSYQIRRNPPQNYRLGKKFLLADAGCGTLDMQSLEYVSDASDGAKAELQNAGPPKGYLCGGRGFEDAACNWLMRKVTRENNSFQEMCKSYGLTVIGCLYIFSTKMEEAKKTFVQSGRPVNVSIEGDGGYNGRVWQIRVSNAEVQSFFDVVIDEIIGHIDAELRRDSEIKTVIITGGFGKSRYLRHRLRGYYVPRGINIDSGGQMGLSQNLPVSRGALLRYDGIKNRNLNSDEKFGVEQIEEYDPAVHPDASWSDGSIETDDKDNATNVFARWVPLTRTIAPPTNNSSDDGRDKYENAVWQQISLKQGQRRFTLQIYWTKLDLAPHDCIRIGGTEDGMLIDGVFEWGAAMEFEVDESFVKDNRSARGEGDYKGWVRQFFYRTLLVVDGANVRVKVQITKKRDAPKFRNGVLDTDNAVIGRTLRTEKLIKAELNPSVRTGI